MPNIRTVKLGLEELNGRDMPSVSEALPAPSLPIAEHRALVAEVLSGEHKAEEQGAAAEVVAEGEWSTAYDVTLVGSKVSIDFTTAPAGAMVRYKLGGRAMTMAVSAGLGLMADAESDVTMVVGESEEALDLREGEHETVHAGKEEPNEKEEAEEALHQADEMKEAELQRKEALERIEEDAAEVALVQEEAMKRQAEVEMEGKAEGIEKQKELAEAAKEAIERANVLKEQNEKFTEATRPKLWMEEPELDDDFPGVEGGHGGHKHNPGQEHPKHESKAGDAQHGEAKPGHEAVKDSEHGKKEGETQEKAPQKKAQPKQEHKPTPLSRDQFKIALSEASNTDSIPMHGTQVEEPHHLSTAGMVLGSAGFIAGAAVALKGSALHMDAREPALHVQDEKKPAAKKAWWRRALGR